MDESFIGNADMKIDNPVLFPLCLPPEFVTVSHPPRGVGGQVGKVGGTLNPMEVSGKVDRILKQLMFYPFLSEAVRTQLGGLLKSCQPDEKQRVWTEGLKLCSRTECIQLFMDCGMVHEMLNCRDGDYHRAMKAVKERNVKALSLLLPDDSFFNGPLPSLDNNILDTRSMKRHGYLQSSG